MAGAVVRRGTSLGSTGEGDRGRKGKQVMGSGQDDVADRGVEPVEGSQSQEHQVLAASARQGRSRAPFLKRLRLRGPTRGEPW